MNFVWDSKHMALPCVAATTVAGEQPNLTDLQYVISLETKCCYGNSCQTATKSNVM